MNKILSGAPEFVAPAVFSGQLQQMSLTEWSRSATAYGRGLGLGRDRGVGVTLGVTPGVGVTVGVPVGVGVVVAVGVPVGIAVGVGVGVGPDRAQYLPPVPV